MYNKFIDHYNLLRVDFLRFDFLRFFIDFPPDTLQYYQDKSYLLLPPHDIPLFYNMFDYDLYQKKHPLYFSFILQNRFFTVGFIAVGPIRASPEGLPGGPAEGRGGQRPPFGAAEYNLYDNLQTPIKKYIFYGLGLELGYLFLGSNLLRLRCHLSIQLFQLSQPNLLHSCFQQGF